MNVALVLSVKTVTLRLSKKNPPDLLVSAEGEVPTSGWKNPALTGRLYINPPKDGIQDFDFVAERPSGIVLTVILPIQADTVVADIDIANYWGKGRQLRGVRVHAATNFVEVLLDSKKLEEVDVQRVA